VRFTEIIKITFPKVLAGRKVGDDFGVSEAVGFASFWYSHQSFMDNYRLEAEKSINERMQALSRKTQVERKTVGRLLTRPS
jgi:hypothetical protein